MKHLIFSIYDFKAEAHIQQFFMRAKGEAIRYFSEVANDSKSFIFRSPQDYVLYQCGEMDLLSGVVTPCDPPIPLGSAVEYKKPVDDRQTSFLKEAK